MVFFPPNYPYRRLSQKDELIAIHFEVFNDFTDIPCVFTAKDSGGYHALFKEILEIYSERKPGYAYDAGSVLNKIFKGIYSERYSSINCHSEKFSEAVEFMNKSYRDPQLTTADIAKECNISEGYLRRIFREESELSPKRYLNRLRINQAVSLVNSGFFSVSQISEMVGFYDPKYFSTLYKKYLGSLSSKYNNIG